MVLKPQDIVVALKLCLEGQPKNYSVLAAALGMSASEVHSAVKRLVESKLADPNSKAVLREPLRNFLVHGVAHAFPAKPREVTRGIPTAWAAPVMAGKVSSSEQMQPVWPDPEGDVQGVSVKPLYPSVAKAVRQDPGLYDLLALVDVLRLGRARERKFAEDELIIRLKPHA